VLKVGNPLVRAHDLQAKSLKQSEQAGVLAIYAQRVVAYFSFEGILFAFEQIGVLPHLRAHSAILSKSPRFRRME